MVKPILEYGCVIFDNCVKQLSDTLESVQYEADRLGTGTLRHTSRERILNELRWKTIHVRRQYHKLVLFYHMYRGLCPTYLSNLVPVSVGSLTGRNLQNPLNLCLPKYRTNGFVNSFLPPLFVYGITHLLPSIIPL